MKLAVIGREPLDQLQTWVVDLFSPIRNTQQPKYFTYDTAPFPPQHLGIKMEVVPIKESRRLLLSFPLPYGWEQQRSMLDSRPSRYVSHLLGHEGKGSLHSYLNNQGWIEGLSAGASMRMADCEVYRVSISLTEEGLKHVEEVSSSSSSNDKGSLVAAIVDPEEVSRLYITDLLLIILL